MSLHKYSRGSANGQVHLVCFWLGWGGGGGGGGLGCHYCINYHFIILLITGVAGLVRIEKM